MHQEKMKTTCLLGTIVSLHVAEKEIEVSTVMTRHVK